MKDLQFESMNHGLPHGRSQIQFVMMMGALCVEKSKQELKPDHEDLERFGIILNTLYQAATCHRGCRGGNHHILEAICARAFNQSIGAFNLMLLGLYDECLNLTRGIGESYHYVAVAVVDRQWFDNWVNASKEERWKKFKPNVVRKHLKAVAPDLLLVDEKWYGDFSEHFIHTIPGLVPNTHGSTQGMAGGVFNKQGMAKAFEELTTVSFGLALLISRFMGFDDLHAELLGSVTKNVNENSSPSS